MALVLDILMYYMIIGRGAPAIGGEGRALQGPRQARHPDRGAPHGPLRRGEQHGREDDLPPHGRAEERGTQRSPRVYVFGQKLT